MKIYEGTAITGVVTVRENQVARNLPHHVRHSPDGFAWGYGGSGPSELARCLLWDVLGEEPSSGLYMEFKFEVLCDIDMDSDFILNEGFIREWLGKRGVFVSGGKGSTDGAG